MTRYTVEGRVHEFRMRELVDYAGGRSEWVIEETGCRTIALGDVSYTEVPRGELPGGKRWLRYAYTGESAEEAFEKSLVPEEDADGIGVSSHQIILALSPGPSEPHGYLDYLRGVSGEPERVGEEEVRGVPTTRYRATVDVVRQTRDGLTEQGWKQANIERYLEGVEPIDQRVEVWIDGDGLVRRIETAWDDDDLVDAVTTTEYFDFGVRADIEAPPASEVFDGEEWQRLEEAKMRKELEEWRDEETPTPLPGAFDAAESAPPPSCLD